MWRAPDSTNLDKRRQSQKVECALLRKEFLWLWDGDSSRNQEGERPPLKTGTRGLL
jgi:hypothetical protein